MEVLRCKLQFIVLLFPSELLIVPGIIVGIGMNNESSQLNPFSILKGAVTNMSDFVRSNLSRSLVHKKNFGLI